MQCQICLHVRVQPHSFKRPLREVLAEEITNTLRLKTIRGVGRTGGTPVLESDILDYSDATVAVNDGAAFVTTVVRTSYWRPELGAVYERNKLKVLAIDEGQLRILLPRPVALSKEEEGAIRNAARIPDYCRASLILEKDPASSIAGSEAALALLAAKSSDEKADQQAIATAFAASLQTFEVTVPAHSLPKGSVYDKAGQFWRVCTQSGPRGQYDDFVVVKSGSFLPFSLQIDNVEFVQVAGSARTGASTDILSSAKGNMLRGSGSGSSSQVGNTPQVSSAAAAMAPFRAGMSLPSGSPRGSKHVDDSTTRVDFANSETQSYIKSDEKSGIKRIRCGGDFTLQRIGAESGAAMTSGPMSSVLPPAKIQPTLNHSSSLLTSDGAHLSWPPSSSLPNRPWLFPPAIGALSFNPGLGFGLSRLQGRVSQKKNDLFSKGGKSDPKKAKVLVPSSPQPSASIVILIIRKPRKKFDKTSTETPESSKTQQANNQSDLFQSDDYEADVVIDVVSNGGQSDVQVSKTTFPRARNVNKSSSRYITENNSNSGNTMFQSSLNHFQLPDEVSDSKVLSALVSARPDKQINNSLDFIDRDLEAKIVAAADGDVELALGIRNATNQRKVRVAIERINTQKLRVSALKEVVSEEASAIKMAYESLIASGQTPHDSSINFYSMAAISDGDAGDSIQQLISNLRIATGARNILSTSFSQHSQNSRMQFTNIDALHAQYALLRSAEALAIASGADFIGPGDRGVMIDAAKSLGVDIDALLAEQRSRKEKNLNKGNVNKVDDDEFSDSNLPRSLFDGDDTLDIDNDIHIENESDNGHIRSDAIPKSLSEKLESDPLFDGLALPDYLVTRRGESLPEDRGQTDDFFNSIPPEIQERQAQLRKVRARSEISHAKRLLLKVITASMRVDDSTRVNGVLEVTDKHFVSDNQLMRQPGPAASLSSHIHAKEEQDENINNLQSREEKLQEAQDLMTSLGFPLRDAKGRAVVPVKEDESRAIAEKKAYNRLTQRPTTQQVDSYAALRKFQAEEALAAGDEEAIVSKLLENVENEDLENDLTSISNGDVGKSISPTDKSLASLKKPLPQKTRLSLLPEGYRNWNEVAVEAARPENAKRASKARAKLSAQQQRVLDGTIKAPKDQSIPKNDAQGNVAGTSTTPRQIRIASNLLGSLQNELSAMACELTGSSKPNPHVELVEVSVTPDLRKAFVRWRVPDDKGPSGVPDKKADSMNHQNGLAYADSASKDNMLLSFSEIMYTSTSTVTEQQGMNKKFSKELQSPYFMDDPSSSSARWLLHSQLRKEITREERYMRAHRRPKKQDKYSLYQRDKMGDTITQSQASKDVASFLERKAGSLRRAVAVHLKLRFTPQLEFHEYVKSEDVL